MRKDSSIHIRLPEPLKKAVEARAKRDEETPAEIHRQALRAFLSPTKQPQRSED